MGIKQYHLLISGRVQGVGYRASAWEQGQLLELTGWVRNLPDGRVEMLIEGEEAKLQQMIDWAGQGPRFAEVAHVESHEKAVSGEFQEFQIR